MVGTRSLGLCTHEFRLLVQLRIVILRNKDTSRTGELTACVSSVIVPCIILVTYIASRGLDQVVERSWESVFCCVIVPEVEVHRTV